MRKDERAALTALLDNVGLGFTKCLAECKLLREFLRRTPAPSEVATVGDIVGMMSGAYGVSVGISPEGRSYVSVMMDRVDTPDGRIYDPALFLGSKHFSMTLDAVAAKICTESSRQYPGRKRTKAQPMKPAKKAKAKR